MSANKHSASIGPETKKIMPVTFQPISPTSEDISFDPPSQPAAQQAAIAIGIALCMYIFIDCPLSNKEYSVCFALVFGGFRAIAKRRLARSATQTGKSPQPVLKALLSFGPCLEFLTSSNALTLKRSAHKKIYPISLPSPSLSRPAPAPMPGYNASPQ